MREGVIIQHGCGMRLFLSKNTILECCSVLCPKCRQMINISLFESTMRKQLLQNCEKWAEEKIKELTK